MTDTVPVVLHFDEAFAWLYETSEDHDLTADEINTVICRLGRNDGPAMLASLDGEGLLTDEAATSLVSRMWSLAETPETLLERETWIDLFDRAGYTIEGDDEFAAPAPRPTETITLYRGAPAHLRVRMAWTTDQARAQWYVDRYPDLGEAHVWVAQVEPWRLLAACKGRKEAEYVINPDGLTITAVAK